MIDDPRVSFFKGWFDETLSHYALPPHKQLFINLDADLYSSTKTVLHFLKPHILPGTYLYFDEFQSREHEPKAFCELLAETGWKFEVVAATRGLSHVLFQRVVVALPNKKASPDRPSHDLSAMSKRLAGEPERVLVRPEIESESQDRQPELKYGT